MYGYRRSDNNGLMTNLNSISSSLSSIDTVGRGRNNSNKASIDNLIGTSTSTSLLWTRSTNTNNNSNHRDTDRYSTAASVRNGSVRYQGSEIYYNGGHGKKLKNFCPTSETALQFLLVPLLLLTITRQVFDFLGQIWLQILVNFFTILIIIVALFGIRQNRISYLVTFILWALFNTTWNLVVICIHTRIRDVGATEDLLSLYTGTTSWWHTNGPGCLPYNISSIQPSISNLINPNIITGCRLDYHLIEAVQAALHASISFIASFICFCTVFNIKRNPANYMRRQHKSDKLYKMDNLTNGRSKINHDPFPNHDNRKSGTASIRRAPTKTSSRSSQHSISSLRSRRRNRQPSDGVPPTPRGSTSSMQRSQKYGSLSSRRSHRNNRRGDISSITYGATGERASTSQRTRLSSLSSADYLPSYQPPHSSNANLLSSYGEISSIDSYNNPNGRHVKQNGTNHIRPTNGGNTNPTYNGSRSSVCSQNANNNANNYDDLSYIYGNNNSKASESLYGASTSTSNRERLRQKQAYHQNGNNFGSRQQHLPTSVPQEIQVETYQNNSHANGDLSATDAKVPMTNGFHSFSGSNQMSFTRSKFADHNEINNNNLQSNYQDIVDGGGDGQPINFKSGFTDSQRSCNMNTFDARSSRSNGDNSTGRLIPSNQIRRPIYSNQMAGGNSETPI